MTSVSLKPRRTTCVFSTTLVVLFFSFALSAQGNFGRILGSVKDPTGALLPGATVNIKEKFMSTESNLRMYLSRAFVWVFFGLALVATAAVAVAGPCAGPGAPSNTQTKCLTAIPIPGSQLQSFDISFVNPERDEYYLADRSTKGVDVIDTNKLKFVRTAGLDKPCQGIVVNSAGTAVNNANSGPACVLANQRWPE